MKYAVKIIKAILVIALTVVVIGIVAIKILSSTILDEGYVFRMLQKSNYYIICNPQALISLVSTRKQR